MKTANETAAWLRGHDNYLILTHRRPDGDTIGCAAALCRALRAVGKTAAILENPQLTARYEPYVAGLTVPAAPAGAMVVSVDIATEGLLPLNGVQFAGKIALCIDHHQSNEDYAAETFLNPHDAACAEGMYEVVSALCGKPDLDMGAALYLGLSTDCGCFKYSNTSARTLRIAADLKDLGVDTYKINKIMFATKSFARLRLESALTDCMERFADGKVGLCILTDAMMKTIGASEDDADDISGFPRNVEGVEISVMIRELPDGAKISLRTGEDDNASAICAHLGGGGHRAAAGATVACGVLEAREKILAAIAAEGVVL